MNKEESDMDTTKNEEQRVARQRRARSRSRRRLGKRLILGALAVAGVALIVLALRPRPIAVDTAVARRAPLAIRLVEPGKTRLRDRHVLRAPIAGNLNRVELWEGDVVATDDVVARLVAIAPPLLSVRDRQQAEARLAASRAGLKAARSDAERARLAATQIEVELNRARKLASGGALPSARVDDLEHSLRATTQAATSAAFRVSVARGELRSAEAVLGRGKRDSSVSAGAIELQAPSDGIVLRVLRRDAGPVAAGEPIIEIGSKKSLEVIVDVLTVDAVRVPERARVLIRGWGGDETAQAHVSRVEPAGFTRVSALGVEEQRVNIVARFDSAQPPPTRLGDAFRVEAEIVLWESPDVLVIPSGAVFRDGDSWAVFRVVDGEAKATPIELGHRGDFDVEIAAGLSVGDEVVVHPGDQLADGVSVERR